MNKIIDAAFTEIKPITKNSEANELKRKEIQQYAREHFDLDSLAQEWENMFYNLLEDKKTNPIVPYEPIPEYKK